MGARSITPIIIIQARMNSKRLPGKVMMDWCGKPMLSWILERLEDCKASKNIIVATSKDPVNHPIREFCKRNRFGCYSGEENNVLKRFVDAAEVYKSDVVIRLTGDNPFVNHELVDHVYSSFEKYYPRFDYVSNVDHQSTPIGLYVEIIKLSALKDALSEATADELEHVTLKIRNNKKKHRTLNVSSPFPVTNFSFTVDLPTDRSRLLPVFDHLRSNSENFSLDNIRCFLETVE